MVTEQPALSRGEMLKQLRARHVETVERTQALLKEQKHIQREVCKLIRDTPKTVPEVAEALGMSSSVILWYMASFKKYGLVIEEGMCGDYPLYKKVEEK